MGKSPSSTGRANSKYAVFAVYFFAEDDATVVSGMTLDDLGDQFKDLAAQFKDLVAQFNRLEKKMDEGFNASKVRDEELLRLGRFSLEANEILRDEMGRRFDQTDKKHDEQIDLLKIVVSERPRR